MTSAHIEHVRFADGAIWDRAEMLRQSGLPASRQVNGFAALAHTPFDSGATTARLTGGALTALENEEFGPGTRLTDVNPLVQAMASFSPPPAAIIQHTPGQQPLWDTPFLAPGR